MRQAAVKNLEVNPNQIQSLKRGRSLSNSKEGLKKLFKGKCRNASEVNVAICP